MSIEFTSTKSEQVDGGWYSFRVTANGGTVNLEYKDVEGQSFQAIDDGSYSADATGVLRLGQGSFINVVIASGAVFSMSRMPR